MRDHGFRWDYTLVNTHLHTAGLVERAARGASPQAHATRANDGCILGTHVADWQTFSTRNDVSECLCGRAIEGRNTGAERGDNSMRCSDELVFLPAGRENFDAGPDSASVTAVVKKLTAFSRTIHAATDGAGEGFIAADSTFVSNTIHRPLTRTSVSRGSRCAGEYPVRVTGSPAFSAGDDSQSEDLMRLSIFARD